MKKSISFVFGIVKTYFQEFHHEKEAAFFKRKLSGGLLNEKV